VTGVTVLSASDASSVADLLCLPVHNRDQTLVDIVPLHHKDIGHALSSVEREGGDLG
jgi:hypothetical protein